MQHNSGLDSLWWEPEKLVEVWGGPVLWGCLLPPLDLRRGTRECGGGWGESDYLILAFDGAV